MIKTAYFRGLTKVAAEPTKSWAQQQLEKDKMLVDGGDKYIGQISGRRLKDHGFYKGTPTSKVHGDEDSESTPRYLRYNQAIESAFKFAPAPDHVFRKLFEYYKSIGRQNRDFYLKQGFRPPKAYKYKTQFPFPNHPKKKQMMEQNQHQVRNTRGAQGYSGQA